MGLLFWRKKKAPKVPLPEGEQLDDNALKFPTKESSEKSFEPKEIKEAVGFDKPVDFPGEETAQPEMPEEELIPQQEPEKTPPNLEPYEPKQPGKEEIFVKMDVYRRIIGEIDLLKKNLIQLNEINKDLDVSEYNEDKHFNKLRRLMKGLHDSLLNVDKTLFKF